MCFYYLLVNGAVHGNIDRKTSETYATSIQDLALLPVFNPGAKRALMIGLGAGSLPTIFSRDFNLVTDTVEIDPEIVDIAEKYFGYVPSGEVAIEDGRTFVERTNHRYDLVLLDAFISEVAPFHLFTTEFFERVDKVLNTGGILGINTVGFPYGPGRGWKSTYRTLKSRFEHVRVFKSPDIPSDKPEQFTNLIFLASHQPISPVHNSPKVANLFAREIVPSADWNGDGADLLTDDYNPMESLNRSLFVAVRRHIIEGEQSILLFDGHSN